MSGGFSKTLANPRSLATSTRRVPGSVMAAYRDPSGTLSQQWASSALGSSVVPDLELIRKKASDRSTDATVFGSVVSSTNRRSLWWADRNTSGPKDEPPMPHSTMRSALTDDAHACNSAASDCMRWTTSNHPSRSLASLPSGHRLTSRRSSRSASCSASASAIAQRVRLVLQGLHQLVEALHERGDTLVLQRLGHVLDVDPERSEPLEVGLGPIDTLGDGARDRAVVDERLDGRLGQGVDGVRTDQVVD